MDDTTFLYMVSGLAFVAIVMLIFAVAMLWSSSHNAAMLKSRKRLRKLTAAGVPVEKIPSLLRRQTLSGNPLLNRIYLSIPMLRQLDVTLERSQTNLSLTRFLLIQGALVAVLFAMLGVVLGMEVQTALLLALLVGVLAPLLVVWRMANNYVNRFNQLLPETVDYIARSLRAGNPFQASIKSVASNMPEPVAGEFATVFDEIRFGIDLDTALNSLAERTGSKDVTFFVTAVLVQRVTGGNLAKVLDRLSAVMRARANTQREIKVLSSEMRVSANILIALPFIVAGILSVTQPTYLMPLLTTEVGRMLLGIQLGLIAAGYVIIRMMVNFKV